MASEKNPDVDRCRHPVQGRGTQQVCMNRVNKAEYRYCWRHR